jgi:hypothetical protein
MIGCTHAGSVFRVPRNTPLGGNLFREILLPAVLLIAWHAPAYALNIGPLLDTCPQFDPSYSQIRNDFEIRRNGVVVQEVPCSEPVSQLPISQYTDELIVLQGLRAVFYMDLGSHHLPWAPGTLYDWMKSKMAGIDISDTSGGSACCETLDGKLFFILQAQDDFNRDFDRGWRGIAGNIDLYAHELRHVDGFPHVSCCGIPNGCDQTYDETNLSPYGIQWWLNAHWLTGDLYVGFSCLDPSQVADITNWHLVATEISRDRFCDNKPPVVTAPAMPGGECRLADVPPDCSGAVPHPGVLWPTHEQFVDVAIEGVTDPDGDAVTLTITGITQDEPLTGRRGAGRRCSDAAGVGTATASVRAERMGEGNGRVYHVSFVADDGRGGHCAAVVTVCVPHDQGSGHPCVDEGPLFDSTGRCP